MYKKPLVSQDAPAPLTYPKEELSLAMIKQTKVSVYKKHLVSQDAPAPLTYAEEELAMIRQTEVSVY